MQLKKRWMDGILAEAANTTIKMPFERGARRSDLRARCTARLDAPLREVAVA